MQYVTHSLLVIILHYGCDFRSEWLRHTDPYRCNWWYYLNLRVVICLWVISAANWNLSHARTSESAARNVGENAKATDQPSFESDRVDVELLDDLKLVVHVLQQTQHLQPASQSHDKCLSVSAARFTKCLSTILRLSYGMPKLRSTYDRRLIHKTSHEERKAFLRYSSLAKSQNLLWDNVRTLAYDIRKRNLSTL